MKGTQYTFAYRLLHRLLVASLGPDECASSSCDSNPAAGWSSSCACRTREQPRQDSQENRSKQVSAPDPLPNHTHSSGIKTPFVKNWCPRDSWIKYMQKAELDYTCIVCPWLARICKQPFSGWGRSLKRCLSFVATTLSTSSSLYERNCGQAKTSSTNR